MFYITRGAVARLAADEDSLEDELGTEGVAYSCVLKTRTLVPFS